VLTFRNAAVDARVAAAPAGYRADWFAFDNATGESRAIGNTSTGAPRMQAPAGLAGISSDFIRILLGASGGPNPSWKRPVQAYFRREAGGWRLVGFERLLEG
jgi:hypothetical protein